VTFILAHIGGGGDWQHSLAALRRVGAENVYVDLSGSGVDGGMLESCLSAVGVERLLWGTDLTMDAGWAKLRYLERLLSPADVELVKWKNATGVFPPGAFPADLCGWTSTPSWAPIPSAGCRLRPPMRCSAPWIAWRSTKRG